jgi:hypothetical protein
MGMDLTPIIVGVAAANVGVFLAGCVLAAYRTWREMYPVRRRRVRPATFTTVTEAAGASNDAAPPWVRR